MAHEIQDVAVEAQGNIYWLWLDFPQPLKSCRSPAKAREIDEGLRGEAMAVAITTCSKVHASSRTLRGSRLGREGLKKLASFLVLKGGHALGCPQIGNATLVCYR